MEWTRRDIYLIRGGKSSYDDEDRHADLLAERDLVSPAKHSRFSDCAR
jgi:hypothetical protein